MMTISVIETHFEKVEIKIFYIQKHHDYGSTQKYFRMFHGVPSLTPKAAWAKG